MRLFEKFSCPIIKYNYFKTAAPFEYVIPSKIESAADVLGTSPAIGWVLSQESSSYPQAFSFNILAQASVTLVGILSEIKLKHKKHIKSANDSLSHKSSHHFIVTKSPNQKWANSWAIITPSLVV